MKKYGLLLCTFLLLAFAAQAQDIITLVNGAVKRGKVVQITPASVIYTDISNPGHKVAIRKSAIASVRYANGSRTVYNLTGVTGMEGYIPDNGKVNGWYFGVTASGGAGPVTNHDPTYTTGSATSGGGTILATGMISRHFGIQFGAGAEFCAYKVTYNNNSRLFGSNDIYTQRYATLPVRLLYLSNSKRRLGFYAVAGIDLSIFVSARDVEHDFLSSYYNNVLLSPYGSCGVVLRNRNASTIYMLGPFFKTTASNIYSQQHIVWNNEVLLSNGNTGNFTTMGITLSVMTNFSKWKDYGDE